MEEKTRINEILKASAALNVLQSCVNELARKRGSSKFANDEWRKACLEFHEKFGLLYFPGGGNTLCLLKKGDEEAIESAIDFLLANPIHFRSGYLKEYLWSSLSKLKVTPKSRKRLEEASLIYLHGRIRREFWYMCRAMSRLGSEAYWLNVAAMMCSDDKLVSKRASWLFAYSLGNQAGEAVHRQVQRQVLQEKYGR